jgi:hypothetical protein
MAGVLDVYPRVTPFGARGSRLTGHGSGLRFLIKSLAGGPEPPRRGRKGLAHPTRGVGHVLRWVSRRSRSVFHGRRCGTPVPHRRQRQLTWWKAIQRRKDNRLRRPRLRYCETGAWPEGRGEAHRGRVWVWRRPPVGSARRPARSLGTWASFIASVELGDEPHRRQGQDELEPSARRYRPRDQRARAPPRRCRRRGGATLSIATVTMTFKIVQLVRGDVARTAAGGAAMRRTRSCSWA